jgi:hypothetical protein
LDKQGQPNPKALVAFSFFARAAMDDPNLDEIDESELVGRYIEAEVTHEKVPHRDDPEKIMTFVRLGKKTAVKRFAPGAKAVEAKAVEAKAVEAKAELDLDEIFA